MKFASTRLLVGVAAIIIVAITAMPSEAAKKKVTAAKCDPVAGCAANCKGSSCELRRCEADGKSYTNLVSPVCLLPNCPSKC